MEKEEKEGVIAGKAVRGLRARDKMKGAGGEREEEIGKRVRIARGKSGM